MSRKWLWFFQKLEIIRKHIFTSCCCVFQPSLADLFRLLPPLASGLHCLTMSSQHHLSTRSDTNWKLYCSWSFLVDSAVVLINYTTIQITNYWSMDWLVGWLRGWASWLIDWLINWLVDWLIDCVFGWCVCWLFDWLVVWLVDWLTDWLTDDWLIDWSIDWLIVSVTGRDAEGWPAGEIPVGSAGEFLQRRSKSVSAICDWTSPTASCHACCRRVSLIYNLVLFGFSLFSFFIVMINKNL